MEERAEPALLAREVCEYTRRHETVHYVSATPRSSREGIATTAPMTIAQKRKALNPRGIDYNHGLPAGQLSLSFKAGRQEFTSATVYVQQRDGAVLEGAGCGGDFHPCGGMRIGPCRFGSLSLLPKKIAGSSPGNSGQSVSNILFRRWCTDIVFMGVEA
jgi:hypothetical protein